METAIATLEGTLQIEADHLKSLKLLGTLYAQKEDYEKAKNYYLRASKVDPNDHDVKNALKNVSALQTGAGYGSAKSSRDVIKDKDGAAGMEKDHRILRTPEEIREAIERSKGEYAKDSKNKKILRKLGELYAKLEEHDTAIDWFQKGLAVDPTSFDLKVMIGDSKIAKLEIEVREAKKALKENPDDSAAKKRHKEAHAKKVAFEVEEYRARVQEHPTDLEQRFLYGRALYESGQVEDAIAEFQKSCKDPRYKLESYNFLGEGFLKQGEPDLAIKQFHKALEDVTGMGEKAKLLRYNLGKALQTAGMNEQALEQYHLILEADVRYKDVKNRMREMKVDK